MKKLEREFKECLETLKHFMSATQLFILKDIFKGEEGMFAVETAKRLTGIIKTMPASYETNEIAESKKIVYLHYFYGGSDWYIVEIDKENGFDEAYGYAILNGDLRNSEWGNISIKEIIEMDIIELDFHFEPIPFGTLGLG